MSAGKPIWWTTVDRPHLIVEDGLERGLGIEIERSSVDVGEDRHAAGQDNRH